MQRSPTSFPLRNYILFVALSFAILTAYSYFVGHFLPHPPPAQVAEKNEKGGKVEKAGEGQTTGCLPRRRSGRRPRLRKSRRKAKAADAEGEAAGQACSAGGEGRAGLGRARLSDEADPYRMLVTFCNRGAALARIEAEQPALPRPRRPHRLSRPRGHGRGPPGRRRAGAGRRRGTPAAKAGFEARRPDHRPGDRPVKNGADLQKALRKTKPNRPIELTSFVRAKSLKLSTGSAGRPGGCPSGEAKSGRFDGGRARARRVESGKGLPPVDARHARSTRRQAP